MDVFLCGNDLCIRMDHGWVFRIFLGVWLVCVCCEPKRWVREGVEECDRVGQTVGVEACVDL